MGPRFKVDQESNIIKYHNSPISSEPEIELRTPGYKASDLSTTPRWPVLSDIAHFKNDSGQ